MTVPNILSIFRIILVPVFILVIFSDCQNAFILGMLIFIVAGITDVLDGRIARKYNCSTVLGKILDPLADKLMVASALFCGCFKGLLPLYLPVIYAVKELLQGILGVILYNKIKDMVPSNYLGKITTLTFYATIILSFTVPGMPNIIKTALVVLCLALLSGTLFYYVPQGIKAFKTSKEKQYEI